MINQYNSDKKVYESDFLEVNDPMGDVFRASHGQELSPGDHVLMNTHDILQVDAEGAIENGDGSEDPIFELVGIDSPVYLNYEDYQ